MTETVKELSQTLVRKQRQNSEEERQNRQDRACVDSSFIGYEPSRFCCPYTLILKFPCFCFLASVPCAYYPLIPVLALTLPRGRRRSGSARSLAMATNLADLMNASKASPNKLTGAGNCRTWAKDMELILVRMGCWEVAINEPPPEADRAAEWTANNNWARSEIHLWCSPDQQDYIIDSELAYDSWKILATQHNSSSLIKMSHVPV